MKYKVLVEATLWDIEAESLRDVVQHAKIKLRADRLGCFSRDEVKAFARDREPGSSLDPIRVNFTVYDEAHNVYHSSLVTVLPPEPPCDVHASGGHTWRPKGKKVSACKWCGMRTNGRGFWFPSDKEKKQ
jgi:hypothetical protein